MNWSIDKAQVLPIYAQYTDAEEGAVLDAELLKGKILLNNEELELGKDFAIAMDAKTGKPSYKNNTKLPERQHRLLSGALEAMADKRQSNIRLWNQMISHMRTLCHSIRRLW